MRITIYILSLLILTLNGGISKLEGKIYCCFPFFNEYELLEMHLAELYPYIDYFVIEESCQTFRGTPKPYNFETNKDRYAKFLDKIIYIKTDSRNLHLIGNPHIDTWNREFWQREQLMNGLVNANDDDIIIVTDCDTILYPEYAKSLPELISDMNPIRFFKPKLFLFFLNYRTHDTPNAGGLIACTFKRLRESSFNFMWNLWWNSEFTKEAIEGAWHFTNAGGFESAYYKAQEWSHSDEPTWSDETISFHVNGLSYWEKIGNLKFRQAYIAPIDDTFPKYVQENLDKLIKKELIFVDFETSVLPSIKRFKKSLRGARK